MRAVEYKASFDRTYKRLAAEEKDTADKAIETLLRALEAGHLSGGLGLKKLQEDQWEIRVGLTLRVCFRMKKDLIEFGIVGTHETIKKFLKNL